MKKVLAPLFLLCVGAVTGAYFWNSRGGTTNPHTTVIPWGVDVNRLPRSGSEGDYAYRMGLPAVVADNNSLFIGRPMASFADRKHRYTLHEEKPDPSDGDPNRGKYLNEAWSEGGFAVERVLYARPGDSVAAGQTIIVVEPASVVEEMGVLTRTTINGCAELRGGSRYVLVLDRHDDGVYWIYNLELGRLNTDATDPDNEAGGGFIDGRATVKQKLREALMAPPYNVVFETLP